MRLRLSEVPAGRAGDLQRSESRRIGRGVEVEVEVESTRVLEYMNNRVHEYMTFWNLEFDFLEFGI